MCVLEAPAPVPGGRGAGAGLLAHRCARRFLPAGSFRQVPDTAAAIVLKAVGVLRRVIPVDRFLILRRPGGIYPKLLECVRSFKSTRLVQGTECTVTGSGGARAFGPLPMIQVCLEFQIHPAGPGDRGAP